MALDKLTALVVRTAPPGKYFDGGSLYLDVQKSGARYWRMKYHYGKRERLLALGVYPEVSLAEARKRRETAKAQLRDGIDPIEAKRQEVIAAAVRLTNSFESVCREWVEVRGVRWTQRHRDNVIAQFERDAFPKLGARPVTALTATEILPVLRKVESRGSLDSAGRLLQRIRKALNYAVATSRIASNPVRDLDGALTPPTRGHHAALPWPQVPVFLKALKNYPGNPETRIALHLILLTFVRSGELRGARWQEFEPGFLDATEDQMPLWTIPAERMKSRREHLVPLAPQVVALFRELHALTGRGEFVLPHRTRAAEGMGDSALREAMHRLGFGSYTVHGFRALASTELNGLGFRPDVVERQLAHVEANRVRAAYHRTDYLGDRRTMMRKWTDLVSEAERSA